MEVVMNKELIPGSFLRIEVTDEESRESKVLEGALVEQQGSAITIDAYVWGYPQKFHIKENYKTAPLPIGESMQLLGTYRTQMLEEMNKETSALAKACWFARMDYLKKAAYDLGIAASVSSPAAFADMQARMPFPHQLSSAYVVHGCVPCADRWPYSNYKHQGGSVPKSAQPHTSSMATFVPVKPSFDLPLELVHARTPLAPGKLATVLSLLHPNGFGSIVPRNDTDVEMRYFVHELPKLPLWISLAVADHNKYLLEFSPIGSVTERCRQVTLLAWPIVQMRFLAQELETQAMSKEAKRLFGIADNVYAQTQERLRSRNG
jgi:hypothetical protein